MDFHDLLASSGLNTLTFSDPFAKILCTISAARELGRTLYFDLDTMFSAYANAGIIDVNGSVGSRNLQADIFLPARGRFMPVFGSAVEYLASKEQYSLVVLDSLNSFYNMYYDIAASAPQKRGTGRLNHFLCVVAMLLTKLGIERQTPVLVTSMLRYRKDGGWVQSPASRRLIQQSSTTRLSAERFGKRGFSIIVEKHPSIPAGERLLYDEVALSLS